MPRRSSPKPVPRVTIPWLIAAAIVGAALGAGVCAWLGARPAAPPAPTAAADPRTAPPSAFAWTNLPPAEFPLPPYARFLAGVTIVLDPGHVGQRDRGGNWKRGPTGLREAEANLRVALYLRDFLQAAGANVVLTREVDESLDLPDAQDLATRAALANELPADLLLSIHHNASDAPSANYTALFYHDSPAHSRASATAARALVTGLNDALRLESHLECPVLSDRVLYNNGLGLLRAATVPAVLSEASFHTNPDEEDRLRAPLYNRREAYGLFLGLARWAQAGLPRVALVNPASGTARRGTTITVALDDGLSNRGGWGADLLHLWPDTIQATLDDTSLPFTFDEQRRQLRIQLSTKLRTGDRMLRVDFSNVLGQPVLHPDIPLRVDR